MTFQLWFVFNNAMDILAIVVTDVDVDVGVDTVNAVVNIVPTNVGGEASLVFALPSTCPTRARGWTLHTMYKLG